MKASAINLPLVKKLVLKDWQLFQKQLAGYMLGVLFALCVLGIGKAWSFYLGSLLLMVLLIVVACFAISTSTLTEHKEQTMPFIMSLPVAPLDFYLAKVLANMTTFGVPFLVVLAGTASVILFTPIPDGLLVFAILIFMLIFFSYCLSLSVAMSVTSEGWVTFVMIASMLLLNPFIMGVGRIPAIADHFRSDNIVWNMPALAILLALLIAGCSILTLTAWLHCRKKSFL